MHNVFGGSQMLMLEMAVGVVSVLIWLYLLFLNGNFWRAAATSSTWNNCGKRGSGMDARENLAGCVPKWELPAVVVIVPARNEAATIGQAVTSLLNQQYGGPVHVIVVDDASTDATAQVARAAAKGDERLTVISGQALPEGWSGKVWAMQQGAGAARDLDAKFLLLTDADVVHAPDSLVTLVTIAQDSGYDLASLMVRLHCESAAERLLIPVFVFFFFMLYPPRWIADPRKRTAGAAGGCMLVRPQALERAGGMKAISGEVIDDCALAHQVKHSGGRVWLGLSADTASVRAHGSFREIGRMVARTAFNQLHHSALMLSAAVVGLAITFVAPIALLFGRSTPAMTLGAVAWSLMTLAYLPMVRFYGLNPLWAVTLPLSASFYMGATVWSAVKFWSGRGGEWKGRAQDVGRQQH